MDILLDRADVMVPAPRGAGPALRGGQPRDELGAQLAGLHDGVDHQLAGQPEQVEVGALLGQPARR